MGRRAETEELGALLQAEVVRRIEGAEVSKALRAQLHDVLQDVLARPGLSRDERRAAGHGELEGARLDGVLGLRIQRALEAALDAAWAAGCKLRTPPTTARVSRHRGERGGPLRGEAFATTLRNTLSADAAEASLASLSVSRGAPAPAAPDSQPVSLVLTDEATYEALKTQLSEASFRRAGTAAEGPPEAGSIEVVQAEAALDGAARVFARKDPAPADALDPDEADPLVGQVLGGKYRIVRRKGRGGFGTVYEAMDSMLGATVAVKVLNDRAARSSTALTEFLEEARRLTTLDHENIVRWITFDKTRDDLHYFVMEYLTGEELDKIMAREGRLDAARTTHLLLQTLDALRAAHHRKDGESLLHLDLKPQNLFVQPGEPEKVKVIDFGIGQHVGAEAIAAAHEEGSAGLLVENGELGDSDLSKSMASVASSVSAPATPGGSQVKRARGGTILYASPEQCAHLAGHRDIVALDGRSDLYSLGVMAFRMLTGAYPFERWGSMEQGFKNHLEVPPKKVGSMGVKIPRKLAGFVDRCLEKDRDDRWADTDEAYAALDAIAHPPAWPRVAAVFVPLLAAVVALMLWLQPPPRLDALALSHTVDGRSERVANSEVYLGPSRPAVTLDVAGLGDGMAGSQVRLLHFPAGTAAATAAAAGGDDGGPAGVELAGWDVGWEDGRLRLEAPPGEAFRGEVEVELRDGDGRTQPSPRFELVALTDDSWRVAGFDVPGRGDKRVARLGLQVELAVEGDGADIERVEVRHPGGTSSMLRGRPRDDGTFTYSLALNDLQLEPGPVTLEARVHDRAGGVRAETLALDVVEGRLRDTEPVINLRSCRASQTVWNVTPNSAPVLSVALARPASLRWSLLDEDGLELGGNSAPLARTHELDIARELFERARRGQLVVSLDESQAVLHPPGAESAGQGDRPLTFRYLASARPRFDVQLAGTALAEDAGPLSLNDESPTLELSLQEQVRTRLDVELRGPDGELVPLAAPAVDGSLELGRDLQDRRATLTLPLARDGEYALTVAGYPLDPNSGAELGEPTVSGPHRLRRDKTRPTPALLARTLEGAELHDGRSLLGPEAGPRLSFALSGEPARADELTVYRQLSRDGQAGGLVRDVAVREGDHYTLALPASADFGVEGPYSLEVFVNDAAGNQAERPLVVDVELATGGPEVTLVQPRPNRPWVADDGDREVRVVVEDGNGVAAVTARVVARDDAEFVAPVELLREERLEDGAESWVGRVVLDHAWSQRDVRLEIDAVDDLGLQTGETVELPLPEIDRARHGRVALARPDRPATPMRLLDLGDRDDYVFGGRNSAEEDDDFRRLGLGRFNTNALANTWQVRIPADTLVDVYIDEREVTELEFLAFVGAADGWGAAANWPREPGGADRRAELAARLEAAVAAAPDRPVTDVSWDEAAAFARWVGKRLPTLVEWECAVRGPSPDYRPYASHPGAADTALLNHDPDGEGGGAPWSTAASGDVCPRSGLRDLCSNVAEWTASPEVFTADGQRPRGNLGPHLRAHLDWLVRPEAWDGWSGAREFWVAGGSYRLPRVTFDQVRTERRERRRPDVGFRCAVDLAVVHDAMERRGAVPDAQVEVLDP